MKLLRKTNLKGWFEYYRTPCPICGHTGGCMGNENGEVVACIRVESEKCFSKNSALPSYLHFLKGKERQKINKEDIEGYEPGNKKKDDNTLNMVYQSLLDCLELDDPHYDHLISPARNLSDEQVMIRNYRSFPDKPWAVANTLSQELGVKDFAGVPGFYQHKNYWTIAGTKGILIPFRNQFNQIVGFQYRIDNPPNVIEMKVNRPGLNAIITNQPNLVQVKFNDEIIMETSLPISKKWTTVQHGKDLLGWIRVVKGNRYYWLSSANKPNGTGSGNPAPLHVAVPTSILKNWKTGELHQAKTVWLSEGPLKCDIAADCVENLYDPLELVDIGTTFIALPGVGAWRLAIPLMKEMGVEMVNICFDADAVSNPTVKKHLLECVKELKEEGFRANLIIWNEEEAKGIDDLLIDGKIPHIKSLF